MEIHTIVIATAKQWGALPWDPVLFSQRWSAVGGSGVPQWVLGALSHHTCNQRRQDINPVLDGAALVFIEKLGANPDIAPSNINLQGLM